MHRFPSLLSEKSKACPPFLNKIHCVVFQKMKFGEDGCCGKGGSVVPHEVVDCRSYTGELRYHIRFITGVQIIRLCQFTQAICFSVCNVPCLIVHGVAFTKQQEGSLKVITDTLSMWH